MTYLRYLGIAFLKWVAVLVLIGFMYIYIPERFGDLAPMLMGWILAFVLSFVFARWAFHHTIPNSSQALIFLGLWMAVTLLGYAAYSFISVIGFRGMISIQLIGQLIFEAVAVLLTAYTLRRRSLKVQFGEGGM